MIFAFLSELLLCISGPYLSTSAELTQLAPFILSNILFWYICITTSLSIHLSLDTRAASYLNIIQPHEHQGLHSTFNYIFRAYAQYGS